MELYYFGNKEGLLKYLDMVEENERLSFNEPMGADRYDADGMPSYE